MQVKGVSIRSVLGAVAELYGEEGLARLTRALPTDVRQALEPVVLASSFYPVRVSAELQEAVRRDLGGGSVAANHRVGAQAARLDFSGIYRVFIRVADYKTLLGGMDRAFRQYNSQGRVDWQFSTGAEAHGAVRGVNGYTEAMWHSIAGRLEAILLLGGARSASVTVEDWSSSSTRFHVRWTPR